MIPLRHRACTGTALVTLLAIVAFCRLVGSPHAGRAGDDTATLVCTALGARSALYLGELK
jgi:hypothetical protein